MVFDAEMKLQGFFPPQSSYPAESINMVEITWNTSRRVYRRTNTGTLVPSLAEPLGSTTRACFEFSLDSHSEVLRQIQSWVASLNFPHLTTDVLSPKITNFALAMAARRLGPPYPSIIIFANVNFVEKLYVDNNGRPSTPSGLVGEALVLGTSAEDGDGTDDEESSEDDDVGASDSTLETLRIRKMERQWGEEESCSVCLETFLDGEEIIPLRCDHIYHESCILAWLKRSQSCPLCRRREI